MALMNERAVEKNLAFKNTQQGFSLLELLIAVAIVGIVAAIAYPGYTNYVLKSKRADGHLALYSAVQTLERCKSTRYQYTGCTLNGTVTSPEGYYTLALAPAPTATAFKIVATGVNSQSSDHDCKTMTIDHRGVLSSTPGTADQDDNNCWNK